MHRLRLWALALISLGLAFPLGAAERPNMVWILSEDNAASWLKLFDDSGSTTPNIEAMAAQGLVFTRAYSCGPVCSVARTTLLSGVHAPRLGTQFHRKIRPAQFPAGWHLLPFHLREAGYYCSNNSKTDYNTEGQDVWDESSARANWRRRPAPDQPFFHMQTITSTHEGTLHFKRAALQTDPPKTDPVSVSLAPYHPDTELFRFTYARYHDRIRQVDDQVGALVGELEKDGLLEDTFIFYFGDNGGVLPGSKGYLREAGLHIPLVVRVPGKWRHLAPAKPGSRVSGMVSFVDLGPTLLHLAGIDQPGHLDGRPILGPGVRLEELEQRNEAFGYADRFDEKCEMVRSLRQGRFKYVRHFQGYYPDALHNNYRYEMLAYQEWRGLWQMGKLNPVQSRFFEPKPAEALFDLESDPFEIRNLAGDSARDGTLRRLRERLREQMRSWPDLSLFPESVLVEEALGDPIGFGRQHRGEVGRLLQVADLALRPFHEAEEELRSALRSPERWERYWALTDCAIFGEAARSLAEPARSLLRDEELLVRVRAAEFLGGQGWEDPRPVLGEVLARAESPVVALLALNAVVYLRDGPRQWRFVIQPEEVRAKNPEVQRRLDYLQGGK